MPSTVTMSQIDCLRIIEILEANHQLCKKTIGVAVKPFVYPVLKDEIEATDKLIGDLKDSITSKVDAQSDVYEDSEHQATIYTPSHTESQIESKHDTSDLADPLAKKMVDALERTTLSKVDVIAIRDALAPVLEEVASKNDALALLKHMVTQKDQITEFRDEARAIDGVNTKEVTLFHKAVWSQIEELQKDLDYLIDKVAAKDDVSALRTHMTGQKNGASSHEPTATLTDQVGEIHSMLGRFRLDSGKDIVSLRQDLQGIRKIVSAITSYDTLQVAGIQDEIASLENKLSDWGERAEKPSLISPRQYMSLRDDIVAAVEEKSARQISLLRDDVLEAVSSLRISDKSATGSNKGSKDNTARRTSGTALRNNTK